ncbi:MAG TPA: hypothetical protein HA224_00860 [Nanoarchaeota archaeon]|nr:hypothetical protein [Nanoarchaeota archaeon]
MAGQHASMAGICVYCSMLATETCSLCGANVCGAHFNKEAGVCRACLLGKRIK